jgi:glycosyltransferase involved in cell wall biosynthesis
MTCQEEETYMNLFRNEIKHRRPDMIFLWGGLVLERCIMREAQEANIPVAFYLVNPGYNDRTVFKDVSVILTDTQATADLYKQRHNFECVPVGKFINTNELLFKGKREPKYITFINPSFEKGVSIFMPLAKLAAKRYPEIKFLVVQSRGVWANALKILKCHETDFPNVKVIGHQLDMRPVYGNSKAVLLPSLWHESGARVIAESQINGIPVIASNTGGSKELIGEGGMVIDIPDLVAQKKTEIVISENELAPWLEAVRMMWHDEKKYQDYCQSVMIEAKKHDVDSNADLFVAAIAPYILSRMR